MPGDVKEKREDVEDNRFSQCKQLFFIDSLFQKNEVMKVAQFMTSKIWSHKLLEEVSGESSLDYNIY